MSDKGLMGAGRKILEARGQPNAMETGDRHSTGTQGDQHGGGFSEGKHLQSGSSGDRAQTHAHAMHAFASAMAAHNNYMADNGPGGAAGGIDSAREGHMHEEEAGQGDVQKLHQEPGSGVGEVRQAFSHAGQQGRLGHMSSVALP
jgi:hypothetical protein